MSHIPFDPSHASTGEHGVFLPQHILPIEKSDVPSSLRTSHESVEYWEGISADFITISRFDAGHALNVYVNAPLHVYIP